MATAAGTERREAQHTPGPWVTGFVDDSDGKDVYLWVGPGPDQSNAVATMGLIGVRKGSHRRAQIEANARAIAALPDVLEAATRVVSTISMDLYRAAAAEHGRANEGEEAMATLRDVLAKVHPAA